MALFGKKKEINSFKARQDTPGGPVDGGNISEANGKNDPARGVPGAVLAGASITNDRTRAATQALSHPSIIAPVLFSATEFGRMPFVLKSGNEIYKGDTPNWMQNPLPNNKSYVWRRFQREVGFELELFGTVGLRVQLSDERMIDGDYDIESVRLVSARRFASLGEVNDPEYIIFAPAHKTSSGNQIVQRDSDRSKYETLTSEPNEAGVFFLQVTTMSAADEMEGLSPYILGATSVNDATVSRLQKIRFWQRDGRKLFGLKAADPTKKLDDAAWDGVKKIYKKALKIEVDNPADVPIFAKQEIETLDLGETMKNNQGVEFAEYHSSQLAMLGRIPEMLIRMGHKSNPNYKIIRAIYQHFISSRIAPALADFAAVLQILMPQGVTIEFDLTDALRSDFETLIATFRQAKALGIFTGDEMRELGGLERTGEADMQKRYVDIQTLPVDKIEDYAESLIQKNKNLGKKNDTRP